MPTALTTRSMRQLKSLAAFIGVALLGLAVWPPTAAQAQSGDWSSIVAAAPKAGKLLCYTGQPTPVAHRITDGIKKISPDTAVEVVGGPSGYKQEIR